MVQTWLQKRGETQYVPAAHPLYFDDLCRQIRQGYFYSLSEEGQVICGFFLSPNIPSFWSRPEPDSLYLSGIVVALEAQGRGLGRAVINFALNQAVQNGYRGVALNSHSGNQWLCDYYESHGFTRFDTVLTWTDYHDALFYRPTSTP